MERLDPSNRVIEYKPDCVLTLHLLEKDHQELPLGYNFCKKSNLSNLENNPLIEYPCLHFENIEGRYFCCSAPWIAFKQNQTAKKSDVSIWNIETGENFKFPVKGYLSSLHILKME